MNNFSRGQFGRIYVKTLDDVQKVINIIADMDQQELSYMPDRLVTTFDEYPKVVPICKFDELNLFDLQALCWSQGVDIFCFYSFREFPESAFSKYPDKSDFTFKEEVESLLKNLKDCTFHTLEFEDHLVVCLESDNVQKVIPFFKTVVNVVADVSNETLDTTKQVYEAVVRRKSQKVIEEAKIEKEFRSIFGNIAKELYVTVIDVDKVLLKVGFNYDIPDDEKSKKDEQDSFNKYIQNSIFNVVSVDDSFKETFSCVVTSICLRLRNLISNNYTDSYVEKYDDVKYKVTIINKNGQINQERTKMVVEDILVNNGFFIEQIISTVNLNACSFIVCEK